MSTLRQAVQDYLEMRRGLGFKLRETGRGLIDFVTFLEANDTPYITTELALSWAQRPSQAQPSHWARRLGYVRVFARHRAAADPRTQIPPDGLLPFRPKRARPYLYSNEDIQRLLSAALEMPCRYTLCKLRPWTYYCLFGLLSVSGLRLGEARNLKLSNIDFDAAVLTIRGTKLESPALCRCTHQRAQCFRIISNDADSIVQPKRRPPICSLPSWAIALMWETFIEHSMLCLAKSACAAWMTATGRVCMTCVMFSRPTRCCVGTKPTKIPSGSCPFCPPTSVMSTWPIPNGTSPVHPS